MSTKISPTLSKPIESLTKPKSGDPRHRQPLVWNLTRINTPPKTLPNKDASEQARCAPSSQAARRHSPRRRRCHSRTRQARQILGSGITLAPPHSLRTPGANCQPRYIPQFPQKFPKDFIFHPTVHIMRYQSRIARLVQFYTHRYVSLASFCSRLCVLPTSSSRRGRVFSKYKVLSTQHVLDCHHACCEFFL